MNNLFVANGSLTLFAPLNISGTITDGAGEISVTAEYGNITGTITSDPSGEDQGTITLVRAGGDINAAISAHTGLYAEACNLGWGSINGTLTTDDGNLNAYAYDDITGVLSLSNGGTLSVRATYGQITANVSSGGDIGDLSVAKSISGTITANGNIGTIEAGRVPIYGGALCYAGASISGTITAGGDIGTLTATAGINAAAWAHGSIGAITPGTGNLAGSFTAATGGLPSITANSGSITASLTAQGTIGNVTALYDISGAITATGSIGDVAACLGSIAGNITSLTGSIGDVSAAGDLMGNLSAHQNIGSVNIGGAAHGCMYAQIGSIGGANGIVVGSDITNYIASVSGDLNITTNGNVTGSISGNKGIFVIAGGTIGGDVKALFDISLTTSVNISGNVTSLAGQVKESAEEGTISGIIKAANDVLLNAVVISNADATGANVIFDAATVSAFYGNNVLEVLDSAPTSDDMPDPQNVPTESHREQVWDAFNLLFGKEGQTLKQAFLAEGNYHFQDNPIDPKGYSYNSSSKELTFSEETTGDYLGGHWWWAKYQWVQLDPYSEAQHIYEGLLQAVGGSPSMQERMLAILRATAPDGLDNIVWAEVQGRLVIKEARQRYFDFVVPLIKELASSYFRGVTLISESANIVVSIGDVINGDYWAALNLVPLLAKVLKPAGKILFKAGGQLLDMASPTLSLICNTGCFVAGTLVAAEDGLKPIETIKEQERIWAFDFISKKWSLQPVVKPLRRHFTGKFVRMTVNGESVTCTGTHAFWVTKGQSLFDRPVPSDVPENESLWREGIDGGRWVAAQDLLAGDVVRLRSGAGEEASIEKITTWIDSMEVFNLWVRDVHSYAVGALGMLVHNDARCAALIEELTTLVKAPPGLWLKGWSARGRAVEDAIAKVIRKSKEFKIIQILDDGTPARNFPVVDLRVDTEARNLISIKSVDVINGTSWPQRYTTYIKLFKERGEEVARMLRIRKSPDMILLMMVPKGGKGEVLRRLGQVAEDNGITLIVGEI